MKALQKESRVRANIIENIHKVKPQIELSRKGLVLSRKKKKRKQVKIINQSHKSLQGKSLQRKKAYHHFRQLTSTNCPHDFGRKKTKIYKRKLCKNGFGQVRSGYLFF